MKKQNIKVTYGVIGLLIIIFIIDFFVWNQEGTKVMSVSHLIEGKQWGYLTKYGRLLNIAAISPGWWRLLTYMFLHANIPHLVINCIGLYAIGSALEQRLGGKNVIIIGLLSGIASAVITIVVTYTAVGANGAIYGMGGALLILTIRDRKNTWTIQPLIKKLLIIIYLIVPNLYDVNTLISNEVGLIAGIFIGLLFSGVVGEERVADVTTNMRRNEI